MHNPQVKCVTCYNVKFLISFTVTGSMRLIFGDCNCQLTNFQEFFIVIIRCFLHNNSKRHNNFLFPLLAGAIYGSFCKVEKEILSVVNYKYTKSFCLGTD